MLQAECERRGIPVTFYAAKHIRRRQLPLTRETFIAGDMDAMHGAMRQLKIDVPLPNDYPKSLTPFLHRRIWPSTLGALEREVLEGRAGPVFAKPADRRKSFTGRVFASMDDFRELGNLSRRQDVWCSEVVAWRSEYRIYVIGRQILSIDCYAGDRAISLDRSALDAALAAFSASEEAPSAYGIDFGVLMTGRTALVEANDGYALGAYEINPALYADLLLTRWRELVSTIGVIN
jgi:hypothetical protein